MRPSLPRALQELLNSRNLQDLNAKIQIIKRTPQKVLEELFLDMCNSGIDQYITKMQLKYPDKSAKQIMIELYLSQRNQR